MRATAVSVTFLLILYGAVSFSPAASAQGDQPHWTFGDYWEYTGHVEISNASFDALVKQEVEGTSPVTVNGTTYDTYKCNMTLLLTGSRSNLTASGTKYVQLSTLSLVRTETVMNGSRMNVTYQPPFELYRFPLQIGQTWSTTSFVTMTLDGNVTTFDWTMYIQVAGLEKVTVPAGTFEAINRTELSVGSSNLEPQVYYSQDVGNEIKVWGSFLGTIPPFLMELKAYNYQWRGGSVLPLVLIGVALAVAIAVAIVLYVRRARSKRPV